MSDEAKNVSKIVHNEAIEYFDHNNNSAIAESSNSRDFIQAIGHFDYTEHLLPIEVGKIKLFKRPQIILFRGLLKIVKLIQISMQIWMRFQKSR